MTEQQIARLASGRDRNRLLGSMGTMFRRGFTRGERAVFEDRHPPVRRDVPLALSGEELRGWISGYTPRSANWHVLPPVLRLLPQEPA